MAKGFSLCKLRKLGEWRYPGDSNLHFYNPIVHSKICLFFLQQRVVWHHFALSPGGCPVECTGRQRCHINTRHLRLIKTPSRCGSDRRETCTTWADHYRLAKYFVRSTKNFSNPIWYLRQLRIDCGAPMCRHFQPASFWIDAILEKFLENFPIIRCFRSMDKSVVPLAKCLWRVPTHRCSAIDSRLPRILAWIPLKFLVSTKI